jgi:hypothetical protein
MKAVRGASLALIPPAVKGSSRNLYE